MNNVQSWNKIKVIILSSVMLGFTHTSFAMESPFVGTWFSAGHVDKLEIIKQELPPPLDSYDHHIKITYNHGDGKINENSCKQSDTNQLVCLSVDTQLTYNPESASIALKAFNTQQEFFKNPPDEDPAAVFLHEFSKKWIDETTYCAISRSGADYTVSWRDTRGNYSKRGSLQASFITLDDNHRQIIINDGNVTRFKANYNFPNSTLSILLDKLDTCNEGNTYNY